MKSPKFSIIIPCYNEKESLPKIISELKKSEYVGQIIVVDDGSCFSTKKILNKLTGVKLLVHPQNRGKSQALKTGILNSSCPYIAFIDADLINFRTAHLNQLLKPVAEQSCDLTISQRSGEAFLLKLLNISFILSGERAGKKDIFIKNLNVFSNQGFYKGYLCEASMNKAFFGNYKIKKIVFKGVVNDFKFFKYGPIGVYQDSKILFQIAKYLGIKELARQIKEARSY